MALAMPDASPVGAGTVIAKALGTKIVLSAMARTPPVIALNTFILPCGLKFVRGG